MARGGDACRAVHVYADVVGTRIGCRGAALAGVHAHAHADSRAVRKGRGGKCALRRGGRPDGLRRDREDHKERIPLDADLDAAVFESVAEDARVRLEDILVAVGAELGLELGRALDVGE